MVVKMENGNETVNNNNNNNEIIYIAPNPLKGSRRFTKCNRLQFITKVALSNINTYTPHAFSKETQIQRWDLKRWVLR